MKQWQQRCGQGQVRVQGRMGCQTRCGWRCLADRKPRHPGDTSAAVGCSISCSLSARLLFLFRWRRSRCRRRCRGGSHRRRCGKESWPRRWRRRCGRGRGSRHRDGGVMPMAVLDRPHFSRRNRAWWLRRRLELLLGRRVNGLRLRHSAGSRRTGLLRRSKRPGQKVGARRTNDDAASNG